MHTRTRSNIHAGKLLSKHKQEGKLEVLHAGLVPCRLTSQRAFQSICLSRGVAQKQDWEGNRDYEVRISVTAHNWNWLPQISGFTLTTQRRKSLSGSPSLTCSLLSQTCCRCLQLNVRFLVGPFLLFGGNKQVLFFFSGFLCRIHSNPALHQIICISCLRPSFFLFFFQRLMLLPKMFPV